MKKVKDTRKCLTCRKVKSIFAFDIIYVPRSPPTSGWCRHVCKDCAFEGEGLNKDSGLINTQIALLEEQMRDAKSRLIELKKIAEYIENDKISSISQTHNET